MIVDSPRTFVAVTEEDEGLVGSNLDVLWVPERILPPGRYEFDHTVVALLYVPEVTPWGKTTPKILGA